MTPREQRKALRRALRERQKEVRAQVDAIPAVQQARARRRRRRLLTILALLLLLLFIQCDCEPGPPAVVAIEKPVLPTPDAGVKKKVVAVKRPPADDRNRKRPRPDYELTTLRPPGWLEEFRMQVAARSPRLSRCFDGSSRPGAVRWSVGLDPQSGTVSDQKFEALAAGDLTAAQQTCAEAVLAKPPYKIAALDPQSIPPTVSLVIEF